MNWTPEHIKELAELEQRARSNTKRLDDHDKDIKELQNVYVALTQVNDKVDRVEGDVSTIKADIKEIKEKPVKRYEQIVTLIITGIGGAIVGLILGQIGL